MRPSSPADAFADLLVAYTKLVGRTARRAGIPDADVPDVVQDVFILCYRAILEGRLDVSRPIGGWLIRTARTVARDRRALKRTTLEVVTHDGRLDADDDIHDQEARMAEAIDVHRVVGIILDKLPPDVLDVFALSDLEGTPMPKIIEELNIPRNTAYQRLNAGREAFRREWERMRKSGDELLAPFVLLDVGALIAADRAVDMPTSFTEDILRRVTAKLGPDAMGPISRLGGAAVGAAGAGTVTLAIWQLVIGAILAALAGAGLYAAVTGASPAPLPPLTIAPTHSAGEGNGVPVTLPAPPSSAAPPLAPPDGTASAVPPESQAKLMDHARAMLRDHQPQKALAILARVTAPEYADERDELRRLALSAATR